MSITPSASSSSLVASESGSLSSWQRLSSNLRELTEACLSEMSKVKPALQTLRESHREIGKESEEAYLFNFYCQFVGPQEEELLAAHGQKRLFEALYPTRSIKWLAVRATAVAVLALLPLIPMALWAPQEVTIGYSVGVGLCFVGFLFYLGLTSQNATVKKITNMILTVFAALVVTSLLYAGGYALCDPNFFVKHDFYEIFQFWKL